MGDRSAEEQLRSGELKFVVEGERLHGSWVLVRMKHDRERGKRTNWLLIKHRDEFAQDGDGDALLPRTVRRVRPRDGRHRGRQGPRAETVHAGQGVRRRRGLAIQPRTSGEPAAALPSARSRRPQPARAEGAGAAQSKSKLSAGCPTSSQPAALRARRAAAPGAGVGPRDQVRRLSHAAARRRTARRTLRTRKGLDWTDQVPARSPQPARSCPTRSSTARSSRSTHNGAPDFAALQAALSDGKTDDLVFFAFDLLFAAARISRRCRLPSARRGWRRLLAGSWRDSRCIRYVEHFETGGDAVLESACRMSLEGIVSKRARRALPSGRSGELDQGQMPRRPRSRDRRLDHDGRQLPLAARRRLSRRQLRPYRPRRHRLRREQGRRAAAAPARRWKPTTSPFTGANAPKNAARTSTG